MDCRKSSPPKYRTNAGNNFEQFCYYGQNKFLAKRIGQDNSSLVFQIDSVINVTKNGEIKIHKALQELMSLVKHNNGKDRSVGGKYSK